jgi:hypothetical protein
MLKRSTYLAFGLLMFFVACSEPEQAGIRITGQTILARPWSEPIDEAGITIRAIGAPASATTEMHGLYDAGVVDDPSVLIEHSKEGYGRKLLATSEYSLGPVNLVKLFPITSHVAVSGEPRYLDTTFVQPERVGVKVNGDGDTTDWGTVVEKSYTRELLAVPITVNMALGSEPVPFWTVDLYYSIQSEIDVMDPTTYLWMQTERFESGITPGSSVSVVLDQPILDWMKRDLAPPGSKISVRAFASPYQRPLNGMHTWHAPFFIDVKTKLAVLSIYEGVISNSVNFILK